MGHGKIVGQSDTLLGKPLYIWICGGLVIILKVISRAYLLQRMTRLTTFSSQIWTILSKPLPGTLETGDRGLAVASLATIEAKVGSMVENAGFEAAFTSGATIAKASTEYCITRSSQTWDN